MHLAQEILGFPRHLSQHVGGFVITRGPLSELVPIENAAMPERTVIQWDKDDIDALGILKVDCLALGMLTAIHKCFDLVQQHHGRTLALANVPAEDTATYDMCCKADTVGVFQIESRAQMAMLPRLRPRCFYDLVVEVAIVRPGPIKGGLVHPYLRRRTGEEKPDYPDPIIEQVLGKTLGVPIFQEQVLRLAMVAAGFTGGEAEQLRRAMGAWRRPGILEKFRVRLRDGIVARGLPVEFAEQVFEQIKGFGEYGFPEAHAASFALLAYVSAWLKCHYPAAFATALLNSQPMGFYAPAQIVRDAREHGVEVRPIDVNASTWDCTLEDDVGQVSNLPRPVENRPHSAMRLGYRLIRGFPEASAAAIVAARKDGEFRSIAHFARRTGLGRALLTRLAGADAFASLGLSRRTALWQVLAIENDDMPLFAGIEEPEVAPPGLPDMSPEREVEADYDSIGLSLKAHPFSFIRPDLVELNTVTARELAGLADQSPVRIAGLVLVRQRPSTAKGTIFITLEDETGVANLIVWPRTWERFRREVHQSIAIIAEGKVERAGDVIHVCPTRLEDLSGSLRRLAVKSRDFR
jgi:error-prone DNA polymerase